MPLDFARYKTRTSPGFALWVAARARYSPFIIINVPLSASPCFLKRATVQFPACRVISVHSGVYIPGRAPDRRQPFHNGFHDNLISLVEDRRSGADETEIRAGCASRRFQEFRPTCEACRPVAPDVSSAFPQRLLQSFLRLH